MPVPKYDFEKFRGACESSPATVSVRGKACVTAAKDFQLRCENDIIDFIGNYGLEHLVFDKPKVWERNPDPTTTIYVDSYEFTTGSKRGYIAFLYQRKTQTWLIKSFKLSDSSPLTFSPFASLGTLIADDK